jgi:hypothetical protein
LTRLRKIVESVPDGADREWLRAFLEEVACMRAAQRAFFRIKGGDLKTIEKKREIQHESMAREKQVDKLMEEPIDKAGVQEELFG